jgi:hypothetical protein
MSSTCYYDYDAVGAFLNGQESVCQCRRFANLHLCKNRLWFSECFFTEPVSLVGRDRFSSSGLTMSDTGNASREKVRLLEISMLERWFRHCPFARLRRPWALKPSSLSNSLVGYQQMSLLEARHATTEAGQHHAFQTWCLL